MTKEMMKEILDDWYSWIYDIHEANRETWTQRDESKINMITTILEDELKRLRKHG